MANIVQDEKDGFGRSFIRVYEDGMVEFGTAMLAFTPAGGIARRFTNKTGAASVRGTLVTTGSQEGAVVLCPAGDHDCIGVMWTIGAADGASCYVIISGVADVLFEDGQSPTIGWWAGSTQNGGHAGRAVCQQDLPDNSSTSILTLHFSEIGHILSTVSAGTDVLARVNLHFN